MDRNYDLFEVFEDGSLVWRDTCVGHVDCVRKLQVLATTTANEVRMVHLPTKTIIAVMNTPKPS
jgi:hypothetical protein